MGHQFVAVVVQSTAACQASLSFTISYSLLKLVSIESVMHSNYLILWHPLLLPSIFPSIRVFSNTSVLHIRGPKYWSFRGARELLGMGRTPHTFGDQGVRIEAAWTAQKYSVCRIPGRHSRRFPIWGCICQVYCPLHPLLPRYELLS